MLTSNESADAEMNPIVAILVGCTLVLIIVLAVTIIAIWKRSRRKKPPTVAKALKREGDSANFETGETALTKVEQNGLEEIGNPDVVPNKNGKGSCV
jgi:heme/copper-type cytochrome/quinol oxidase subunit 2